MDALIPLVAAPAFAEMLKLWGPFAIVLMLLGLMLWLSRQSTKAERAENVLLRAEISKLQELRLQDAQRMIEVAKAGTATIAERTNSDVEIGALLSRILTRATATPLETPATPALAPPLRSP